jgi:hypothetical protein
MLFKWNVWPGPLTEFNVVGSPQSKTGCGIQMNGQFLNVIPSSCSRMTRRKSGHIPNNWAMPQTSDYLIDKVFAILLTRMDSGELNDKLGRSIAIVQ